MPHIVPPEVLREAENFIYGSEEKAPAPKPKPTPAQPKRQRRKSLKDEIREMHEEAAEPEAPASGMIEIDLRRVLSTPAERKEMQREHLGQAVQPAPVRRESEPATVESVAADLRGMTDSQLRFLSEAVLEEEMDRSLDDRIRREKEQEEEWAGWFAEVETDEEEDES